MADQDRFSSQNMQLILTYFLDIELSNNARTLFYSVSKSVDYSLNTKFRVNVRYDGKVLWYPGFKWETSCAVDLLYFPFDQQICKVW